MLPGSLKSLPEQFPELPVGRAVEPAEHFYVLEGKFERCRLEADIPRGVGQHEAEVDMNKMPVPIEEDVAVVPVLNLEEVRDDGIACIARQKNGGVMLVLKKHTCK